MGMGGQDKGASYEASNRTMSTQVSTCKGYNTSWTAAVFGVCLPPALSQTAGKYKMKIPTVMYHRLPADEAERGGMNLCEQASRSQIWVGTILGRLNSKGQQPF